MSNAMFMAWSSPTSQEADGDLNDWYLNTHIPQVRAAIPAVTAVRRYAVLGTGGEAGPRRYLCCYELADADIVSAAQLMAQAAEKGLFDMTPAMDTVTAPPELNFLEPLD